MKQNHQVTSKKRRSETGAWLSLITYLLLAIFKLTIGTLSNSEALRADGMNNVTDIIASVAVLIGIKIAKRPADHDHPYGHRRAETVASLFASFVMASISIQVLVQAIKSLITGNVITPDPFAAWSAFLSALIMYLVYRYNLRLSRHVKSHALKAVAKDNLSDAWVSIGAGAGILAAQWNLAWLDPFFALIVGCIIAKTAWEIFIEAAHMLTDGFDEKRLTRFRQHILRTDGVLQVRDVKARTLGNQVVVQATIIVAPHLSIEEGHEISDAVELSMAQEFGIHHTHIHVEPASSGSVTKHHFDEEDHLISK